MNKKHLIYYNVNLSVSALEKELSRIDGSSRYRKAFISTLSSLAVVAAVAVLAATLWFPILQIYGESMSPVLKEGDIVLAYKKTYPQRGDIIAFYYGNKLLIKRCIAKGGDVISINSDGKVYLNGTLIDEPYARSVSFGECDIAFPLTVPENRLFVLGDKRDTSVDSRSSLVGCVSEEQLLGRVIIRIWPLKTAGKIF